MCFHKCFLKICRPKGTTFNYDASRLDLLHGLNTFKMDFQKMKNVMDMLNGKRHEMKWNVEGVKLNLPGKWAMEWSVKWKRHEMKLNVKGVKLN